jgi:hypothetical protein
LLHPGSRIRIPDPGGKKSTGSRIPDPDPQHCVQVANIENNLKKQKFGTSSFLCGSGSTQMMLVLAAPAPPKMMLVMAAPAPQQCKFSS